MEKFVEIRRVIDGLGLFESRLNPSVFCLHILDCAMPDRGQDCQSSSFIHPIRCIVTSITLEQVGIASL